MPITYNADDIFEIAQQIERNGARFYRKAADPITNPDHKKLLLDLASMEDKHLKTFTDMRAGLIDADRESFVSDPYDEAVLYLQSVADGHVFDVRTDPSTKLTGRESIADILHFAIDIEKDSVVFYVGIRESVSERLGKDKMSQIIAEELSHITILSGVLDSL
jgi:rubrerythrin